MKTTLYFTFEKETKGAVRYKEVTQDGKDSFSPQIGTLYVRKSAMPQGIVKNLVVDISERISV